jgi:hypothetical protein
LQCLPRRMSSSDRRARPRRDDRNAARKTTGGFEQPPGYEEIDAERRGTEDEGVFAAPDAIVVAVGREHAAFGYETRESAASGMFLR